PILAPSCRVQHDAAQAEHQRIPDRRILDLADRIADHRKCPEVPLGEEFGDRTEATCAGSPLVSPRLRIVLHVHHFMRRSPMRYLPTLNFLDLSEIILLEVRAFRRVLLVVHPLLAGWPAPVLAVVDDLHGDRAKLLALRPDDLREAILL